MHHKTAPRHPATTRAVAEKEIPTVADAMKLIDARDEWSTLPPINIPRYPAESYLKDLTIVIDPGHGGKEGGSNSTQPAGYKAGPTGEKEAFMNLRVALLLERLLKDAGANVILTRHGDDTLSLHDRAQVANNAPRRDGQVGADLFVSIHHNAGSRTSNFPSVWYHGSVDNNEPDLDAARQIALELGKQLHIQVGTAPIFSSELMYRGGFGVLRDCHVPAVLCECSFFSYPPEEQRLRDATYNLREAYAIYLGLCQWAYCGRPTQTPPQIRRGSDGTFVLTTTLNEGLPKWWGSDRNRILASSLQVTFDGNDVPARFNESTKELSATLPGAVAQASHVITIHHASFLKNSNWPQRYAVTIDPEGAFQVQPLPAGRGGRSTTGAASRRATSR